MVTPRQPVDEFADQLLAWLRRKAGPQTCKLRAQGLAQRAIAELGLDPVSVYGAFSALRSAELVAYSPDHIGAPYTGFVAVVAAAEPASAATVAWAQALERVCIDPALRQLLLPAHRIAEDLDEEDMRLVIEGLVRIQQARGDHRADFGFELSARQILSSSKVLSSMPQAVQRLLRVDQLSPTPRYVVVAGPANPEAVLLIENATSFELAVRAGLDERVALIAAYGYGLNLYTDSSAGLALLDSLTSRRCEVLSRTGQGHSLPVLLAHPKLFFWGDLDREGLRIALALRERLPQLRLSALYEPMQPLICERRTSHPYAGLSGKPSQAVWVNTGEPPYDQLAALCRDRAVDQEAIDVRRFVGLAGAAVGEAPEIGRETKST